MPEGPEIRRAADRLAKAIVGNMLAAAWFAFPDLKRYESALVGKRVEAITPHGKALLTRFEGGLTMYSHNQLYGVWKVVAAGARPETNRSLRVALDGARKSILLYSASDVSIWPSDQIAEHPFLQRLGPDVLNLSLTPEVVAARLLEKPFAKRQLAVLLLDQHFLAGMGNYLRSEVLFESRLDPMLRPIDLSAEELVRLSSALLAIPRSSYETRGIRPTKGMRAEYLDVTPQGFRMRVFGRAGEPCERCAEMIVRREVAGRRLYLCPSCQNVRSVADNAD